MTVEQLLKATVLKIETQFKTRITDIERNG
jgi:hypothetical protein